MDKKFLALLVATFLVALTLPTCLGVNHQLTLWYVVVVRGYGVYNETLEFELPLNLTGEAFSQKSRVAWVYGDISVEDGKAKVYLNRSRTPLACMAVKVTLNTSTLTLKGLTKPAPLGRIPAEVKVYIGEPDPEVLKLKSEVNRYLAGKGLSVGSGEVDVVKLAFYVSSYVAEEFSYSASLLPRNLSQVIQSRKGDCDDLARVFTQLMWCYGVPCQLEYSVLYLENETSTYPVGKGNITYENASPHAYALVYIPDSGWWPVDITFNTGIPLSGAKTLVPTVALSRTLKGPSAKEVKEFKEFSEKYSFQVYEALFKVENLETLLSTLAGKGVIPFEAALQAFKEKPVKIAHLAVFLVLLGFLASTYYVGRRKRLKLPCPNSSPLKSLNIKHTGKFT